MGYRIALLLKQHYYQHYNDHLPGISEDVSVEYFTYDTLDELKNIYLKIKDDFEGFLVSGIAPMKAIYSLGEQAADAVVDYFHISVENTYHILLQQIVLDEHLKLSRIGMDFIQDGHTLKELLVSNRFAQRIREFEEEWRDFSSSVDLDEREAALSVKYRELAAQNKLDMIITYFYSVIENMRDTSIPCIYVYPDENMISDIVKSMKKSISIKNMKSHLPAVIHINMENMPVQDEVSYEKTRLEINKMIMELNQKYLNRLVIKNTYRDFELYGDYSIIKEITGDFKKCQILEQLHSLLSFKGSVGYGIGHTFYQARINAVDASHYSRNGSLREDGSYLIDENDQLTVLQIGLVPAGMKVSGDYINDIADKVSLSSETIVRIIRVMKQEGTNKLTTQELMHHLNISSRAANKFLAALQKDGYAEVVGMRRSGNKGRPINIYQINLKY